MSEGIGSAPSVSSTVSSPSMGNNSGGFEGGINNSEGFSSKGFADFKPGFDFDKPSVDINHGKENNSMFKDIGNIKSGKGLFDISKPTFDEKVEPHKSSIIDIEKGKEDRSMFKDPNSLDKKPGIFDISKPVFDEKIESFGEVEKRSGGALNEQDVKGVPFQKIGQEVPDDMTEKPRPQNESIVVSHRKKSEVDAASSSEALSKVSYPEQESNNGVLKSEPKIEPNNISHKVNQLQTNLENFESLNLKPQISDKQEVRTTITTLPHEETSQIISAEPEVRTEVLTQISEKIKPATQILTLKPEATPTTRVQVAMDLEYAKSVVPKIMEVTNVTEEKALELVNKALVNKYKSNPEVKVLTQTKSEVEVLQDEKQELQVKVEDLVEEELEKKVVTKKHEVKKVMEKVIEKLRLEKKLLYFAKDRKANRNRVTAAVSRAQFLFYQRQLEKRGISGKDIADLLPDNGDKNMMSELVEMLHFDGSYDDFKSKLAKQGEFESISEVKKKTEKLAEDSTAVRLTFSEPKEDSAEGQDAAKVYRQPLDGVKAYVEEEGSVGNLYANQKTRLVEYINHSKQEYPVATELIEDIELDLAA